jgi:hypothetical protein
LAVEFNANLGASQTVATIFNRQSEIKGIAAEQQRSQEQQQQSNIAEVAKSAPVRADITTIEKLEADRSDQHQATLDAPDRNTQKAITAYRDLANTQKREEIQSLVGVDLFV